MTPSAIRATVRDYIRMHQIFRPGPLIVAVSGGADSTALLLVLAELADELGIVPHVAHFDHRTQPARSAEDADFVAKLANRIGAPVRIGRAERATKSEDDARRARYTFLRRAAAEIGATAIATGHTRDDQAETVLLHLARGSGLAGLAGIRPIRDGLARPLLCIGRAETIAVCRAARIRPRADPTNRSLVFARNRVRHRVIPELAKINPRVAEAVARLADAAAAIAWLRTTGQTLGKRHRDALIKLTATTDGSSSIDLPGGRALREYATLRIVTDVTDDASDPPTSLEVGRTIHWNGWSVSLGTREPAVPGAEGSVPKTLLRRLVVRSRADGDRTLLTPRRKLQDLFVDAKIPAAQRARWPVFASPDGVWWVPGIMAPPPATANGTRLAVAAPKHMGNVLWTPSVRQVASKTTAVAARPRGGPRN
ncbi:MAG: tRNA lysidine(34) synthetase TilS [Chloroflexi bacterium]|nr:MAG: tRNA lysidine(34) synthetase TilS [Chloroflexota bacterium]